MVKYKQAITKYKIKSKYMIFHVPNKDIQYLTLKIDNVIIKKWANLIS